MATQMNFLAKSMYYTVIVIKQYDIGIKTDTQINGTKLKPLK